MSHRTKPLILSTAMTGVRFSPWKKDAQGNDVPITSTKLASKMPVSSKEVIKAAKKSYKSGARFIHIHARNPKTGEQFSDIPYYEKITKKIRKNCPGVLLSYPTSRKGEVEIQIEDEIQNILKKNGTVSSEQRAEVEFKIRAAAVEAKPDTITSFTVPELKMFGTPKNAVGIEEVPGWTDTNIMKQYYNLVLKRMEELKVHQEIEIQTLGQFEVMRKLYDFGGMEAPIHLVLLPGFSAGFPIKREAYETALEGVDDFRSYTGLPVTVTCGAVIVPPSAKQSVFSTEKNKHDYREVFKWIAEDNRVDVFRTGVEDTPVLYGQQMSNSKLVKHAEELCEEFSISVEKDPHKVRDCFGFNEEPFFFSRKRMQENITMCQSVLNDSLFKVAASLPGKISVFGVQKND